MNTNRGRTITLDVNPDDTVGEVKTKLEAKTLIPSTMQRLSFNGKCLVDSFVLKDYGVQKESNLRLNLHAMRTAESTIVTIVDKAKAPKIGVDWHMLANDARSKLDEQIHLKKEMYDDLMKERTTKHKKLENLKMKLGFHLKAFSAASSQMRSKAEEVAVRERKLSCYTKREQLRQESLREMDELKMSKDSASYLFRETKETINEVELEISKLDAEMGSTAAIDISSNKTDSLKEILMEVITQKEEDLQCPVCYLVSPPPLYKCTREHLICSKCFARVRNKCPTCRSGYSRDNKIFRLAEQNWRDLQKLKSKLD